jgi:hypothetical protein
MGPTNDERLAKVRDVVDRALREYSRGYVNTDAAETHEIAERELLMAYMRQYATVLALLEVDELTERSMLATRRAVVDRYLGQARRGGRDPSDGQSREVEGPG